ncbi:hypothetical protein ACHAWT_002307 [Skeletonema menzelii]
MFLTGFAGAGKSTCVTIAQRFCFEFCRAVSIPWNNDTFLFTATTGAAASLFNGRTIHDAAFLNGKESNISNALRQQWQNVSLLIIDEISFFTMHNLTKLDHMLKNIKGVTNKPFGGVSIVFSGDFHQLPPIMAEYDSLLYDGRNNGFFLGCINSVVILEVSHRFDDDPVYGAALRRMWSGEFTVDDVRYINSRLVGQNGVTLPPDCNDSDTTYATPLNKQRNGISSGIFRNHLQNGDFPSVDSDDLPPDHTIIIEADIRSNSSDNSSGRTRLCPSTRDAIINTCGDADVRAGRSKLVDPCLKLYVGAHVMCNNNDMLKSHHIGNGTLARVKRVKLKPDASIVWKNWEGKKVQCVSVRDVEYVEVERFPESSKMTSLRVSIDELEELESKETLDDEQNKLLQILKRDFVAEKASRIVRLAPSKTRGVKIEVNVTGMRNEKKNKIKKATITQVPINMNDATTGHKLQGMSKDKLIVTNWTFKSNWVYVVLSRVRTLSGLYLLKPLPEDRLDSFSVPPELRLFEDHMRGIQEQVIAHRESHAAVLNDDVV